MKGFSIQKMKSGRKQNLRSSFLAAITVVTALSLTGCFGQNVKPQQGIDQASQMTFDAPRDTAQFYYAVGEGDTVEMAKNRALSQIASRISVSVSASLSNQQIVRTENYQQSDVSETTETRVDAIAETIEFTGVSIEQTDTVGDKKHVIVKVDRNVLFQSYLRKFESVDGKMKKEIAIFDQSPVFSQLKLSHDIVGMIAQAEADIKILKAMNPGFDDKLVLDRYSDYETSMRGIKQKAVFSITADKNSQSLATLIKGHLSDENIKLGTSGANVKLHISTKATDKKFKSSNSKLANMKIVNRVSTLKVKDSKGVVISNNVVKTKASSTASREDAIQQTKQYEKLIAKNGVLSFISGQK